MRQHGPLTSILVAVIAMPWLVFPQSNSQGDVVSSKGWSAHLVSVRQAEKLEMDLGNVMAYDSARLRGGDAFLLVSLRIDRGNAAADLTLSKKSVCVVDEQGGRFAMYGVFSGRTYDLRSPEISYTKSGDVTLIFCVSGGSSRYSLTLSDDFPPQPLSATETTGASEKPAQSRLVLPRVSAAPGDGSKVNITLRLGTEATAKRESTGLFSAFGSVVARDPNGRIVACGTTAQEVIDGVPVSILRGDFFVRSDLTLVGDFRWDGNRPGATHTIVGNITLFDYAFESSREDPLVFVLTEEGYQYKQGTGKVLDKTTGVTTLLPPPAMAVREPSQPEKAPTGASSVPPPAQSAKPKPLAVVPVPAKTAAPVGRVEPLRLDGEPFLDQNTVMVPLRGIFEWLGADVRYEAGRITALPGPGDTKREIRLRIGERKAFVNDAELPLAVAPTIRRGRTYVPLRFVSEALGASVAYDPEKRSVGIRHGDREAEVVLGVSSPQPSAAVTVAKTASPMGTNAFRPDLVVPDYLLLSVWAMSGGFVNDDLEKAAIPVLKKHGLINVRPKELIEYGEDSPAVMDWQAKLVLPSFGRNWVDPLFVALGRHGDFPAVSFRNGHTVAHLVKGRYQMSVSPGTEIQLSGVTWIFQKGKWVRR